MFHSAPISFYFLLFLSSLSYFTDARTSDILKVKLDHGGVLVGRHLTSLHGRHIRAFLGVPYAQPPVGDLRFKATVPYGSWEGKKLATQESGGCSQLEFFSGIIQPIGGEDCLYLNVYTPEEPQTNKSLPVMVWIHGGAFFMGSTLMYSPKYILDKDVIYVSLNYRLGPLGFLSSETLDCPGNNGLKDQKTALEWVHKNIAAFGGDPNHVTIFGESAGAASVTYHMISEKSKGLFQKAIAQSGTFYNPWAKPPSPGVVAKNSLKLSQIVGCDISNKNWPNILQCLRTRPAENISAAILDFIQWDTDPIVTFRPVVEPEHKDAFLTKFTRNQESASVPLLIGFNSDEGLLRTAPIVNQPNVLEDLKNRPYNVLPILLNYFNQPLPRQNEITKAIIDFYFKDGLNFDKNNFQNFTDMTSDSFFIFGIDEQLRERLSVKDGKPTYLYLFEHKGSSSLTDTMNIGEQFYGTAHMDDTFFLFPISESLIPTASPTKRDREVRQAMLDLWINFASTSDPTPPGTKLPKWSAVKDYPPKFIRISSKDERDPILRFSEDYPLERINFWHAIKAYLPAQTNQIEHQDL